MADKQKLITDWIQCEITDTTIEVHRGRNGYEWDGQKGKILEWSLPVLVEKSADEILEKVYSCPDWKPYGKGREVSLDSKDLRDKIWQLVMPYIDIKNLKTAPAIDKLGKCQGKSRASMNRTQKKGTYVDENRIKKDKVIPSNECYTFYQSVEFVVNWFLDNVDKNYFKNKVVYCNCDDVRSAFWIFFYNNFHKLGLKKLIATSYDKTGLSYGNNYDDHIRHLFYQEEKKTCNGYVNVYDGKEIKRIPPENEPSTFHGDFRDKECYNIAKNEADIIMTNPPFGKKWKQYVNVMLETGKKLIFWGNGGAPIYNWFMPMLDDKKIFIARECSDHYFTDHYMSPTYHRKRALAFIYTTEDLSFQKPKKRCYSKKRKMLKEGSAWYDDNCILVCDGATIPTDTDETLAVSVNIIKAGILNNGYEILKNYQRYAPIKDGNEKFARILIQKKTK